MSRSYNRYGDGKHNDAIAKLMAALYLTLRGTPIMYYGEEIGMENNDPKRKEDVKDPIGRIGWPKEKGRDGERTPMQWNDRHECRIQQERSVAAGAGELQDAQRRDGIERSEFGPEHLQERAGAAAHEQSAARGKLHRAQ